jgi:hypothetical protein
MKPFRPALVLACLALGAVPAFADVTMKMTVSTSGGPVAMEMSTVTYIKGMKMRSDVKVMDQDMSMFVDVAAKQQVMVNNVTKQVQDLGAALANMPMSFGEATVSVKPSGQTKAVLGRTCAGFTVEITMPMTIMDETLTMSMSGLVWIAKEGEGVAEYQAFNKAAAAAGLLAGPFTQGPTAKGLAQMQAAFAENGVPLEQDMQISITGSGQMAQMMFETGAGNMRTTTTVTAISVDAIPAEMFTVPGGAAKK